VFPGWTVKSGFAVDAVEAVKFNGAAPGETVGAGLTVVAVDVGIDTSTVAFICGSGFVEVVCVSESSPFDQ